MEISIMPDEFMVTLHKSIFQDRCTIQVDLIVNPADVKKSYYRVLQTGVYSLVDSFSNLGDAKEFYYKCIEIKTENEQ